MSCVTHHSGCACYDAILSKALRDVRVLRGALEEIQNGNDYWAHNIASEALAKTAREGEK